MLRVDSSFVGDIESGFYSTLDLLGRYPEKVISKTRCLDKWDLDIANKLKTVEEESFLEDFFKVNNETSFDEKEIDLFLSILSNIEIQDFEENQAGIVWYFGLLNNLTDIVQKAKASSIYKGSESSEIHRFLRLKYMIETIAREKKYILCRLFELDRAYIEHFFIKISSKFRLSSPPYFSEFLRKLESYRLNFIVMVLMSEKYHFIHKFCMVAMLKSSYSREDASLIKF